MEVVPSLWKNDNRGNEQLPKSQLTVHQQEHFGHFMYSLTFW